MKFLKLTITALALVASNSLVAEDGWYPDAARNMVIVESDANAIWLLGPKGGSAQGIGGPCYISQIKITPPTPELREEWLGMLLTAMVSKGKIHVWGDCTNPTLTGSRIQIEP